MPALVTRPGVPIAQVGTWDTSTGVWECTREQLADAVRAQHDPDFRVAIIKIGHTDPRFNDHDFDGTPAVGRLENLRLTQGGDTLVADFVGLPAWLDDILASAYPSRSVEAWIDITSPSGNTYAMAVTGVALLGVTPPAIESLTDIAALYQVPTDVGSWVGARRIAATALKGNPMHKVVMPPGWPTHIQLPREVGQLVAASASIDDLYPAFEAWSKTNELTKPGLWVTDIFTDSIVGTRWSEDTDRQMWWQVKWKESKGEFTFSDPVQVEPTYRPLDVSAASGKPEEKDSLNLMETSTVDDAGAVEFARDRAAASTVKDTHTMPLSSKLAERLGVSTDADEDEVLAALETLATPAVPENSAETPPPLPADTAAEVEETIETVEIPVDVPVAASADPELSEIVKKLATELSNVKAAYGSQLEAATGELAAIKAAKAAETKARVLATAVADGKITPADEAKWAADYDKAPEVITGLLERMRAGSAFPVGATGHADDVEAAHIPAAYAAIYGGGN